MAYTNTKLPRLATDDHSDMPSFMISQGGSGMTQERPPSWTDEGAGPWMADDLLGPGRNLACAVLAQRTYMSYRLRKGGREVR